MIVLIWTFLFLPRWDSNLHCTAFFFFSVQIPCIASRYAARIDIYEDLFHGASVSVQIPKSYACFDVGCNFASSTLWYARMRKVGKERNRNLFETYKELKRLT